MSTQETKRSIIQAGRAAVEELIKVAKEKIITNTEEDLSADKLKNAAATKKLAIFDAFEILTRVEEEELILAELEKTRNRDGSTAPVFRGLAEGRKKK